MILNGKEISNEEFEKIQEDANSGKVKLVKISENEYKTLNKIYG